MSRTRLPVAYSQYYLTTEYVHGGDAEEYGTDDGLVTASDDAIRITTGTHTGTIDLEMRILDAPPAEIDDSWEAITERSFHTKWGDRQIWDWDNDAHEELPTIPEGGSYRLRAHARGRGLAAKGDGMGDRGEQHLLLIWPAPPGSDVVYKMDIPQKREPEPPAHTERSGRPPRPPMQVAPGR